MLPFELFGLLLAALGAGLLANEQHRIGRAALVTAIAWSVLFGAVLQAIIGVLQIGGWAPLANGWIVFNDRVVLGNIGSTINCHMC